MLPWQQNMVDIVNSTGFSRVLLTLVRELDPLSQSPEQLLDALRNWFSTKNPGFFPTFWSFTQTSVLLHLDYDGIYFQRMQEVNHEEKLRLKNNTMRDLSDTEIASLNTRIAQAIGDTMWSITFKSRYPLTPPAQTGDA